jgi:hypothetical protein
MARLQKGSRMKLKKGDHVQWTSRGKTINGRVQRVLTAPITIQSHHVAASPAHPELLVKSDATGKIAAHTSHALKKI